MVETTLALVITALISYVALLESVKASRMEFASVQGGQLATVRNAAESFASENFTALQSGQSVTKNGVTLNTGAGAGQTYAPTIANLVAMGYLPTGFTAQGSFSNGAAPGNYQIVVRRTPTGCELTNPATCDITGIVYIDQPIQAAGSTEIDGPALTSMMESLKEFGGLSLPTSPTQITGASAGWTDTNPVAGQPAGVIAARFGFSASGLSSFIRLNDTRDPNLQGKLTVKNDVIGKANIGTSDGIATCLRAALQSDGQIISRASDCITRANINPNTGTVTVSDTAGTAQVTLDGSTGNVTANGRVTSARANLTVTATPGTACTTEGDIVRDSTSTSAGLLICRSNRYVSAAVAAGSATVGSACDAEGGLARDSASMGLLICRTSVYRSVGGLAVVTAGAACTPNGSLAQTSTGSSVICQNGLWIDLAGRIGSFAFIGAYEVSVTNAWAGQGAVVYKPSCLANGTAKIYLMPKSEDQIGFINRYATDGGSYWQVYALDGSGNPVYAVMIAQAFCYYT